MPAKKLAEKCTVPGCGKPAPNSFSVRLRKPKKRNAVWAPESAYMCDEHARLGWHVEVKMTPLDEGHSHLLATDVMIAGGASQKRITFIDSTKKP